MFTKKIVGLLVIASILTGSIAMAQSSGAGYQNWADFNVNGVIDPQDQELANAYYTANMGATYNTVVTPTATPGQATVTPVPTLTNTPTPQPTNTATSTPTKTPIPATLTPTPSPTMDHSMMGICGESMDLWHPPVVNGCETKHEHGDAPPAWVVNSGKAPMFHGNHSTSALENTTKHNFMKGYLFQDSTKSCLKIYVIQHGGAMGMERITQFHSTQWWVLDCGGGVSYGSMWSDFGTPKAYPAGDRVTNPADFDRIHQERANEGIIRVATANSGCEQWYGSAGGIKPDMSLLTCGAPEIYNSGEDTNPQGEYDPANWQLTGNIGTFRQLDFSLPADRLLVGTYMTDQFARVVNNCSGNVSFEGVSYPIQCQNWKVTTRLAQDLASDTAEFGIRRLFGIARNENYPAQGVVAPN